MSMTYDTLLMDTPRAHPSVGNQSVLASPVHASSVVHVGIPCNVDSKASFRMRIIEMDHYMAAPIHTLDPTHSIYHNKPLQLVPVHRLHGTTPAGQKCCLHIHNYLPYFYVPVPLNIPDTDIETFISALGSSITIAYAELSARRRAETWKQPYQPNTLNEVNKDTAEFDEQQDEYNNHQMSVYDNDKSADQAEKERTTIYSMILVSAKSVFGYTPTNQRFIKITLLNPAYVKSVAAILQSGCILQQVFQPYESHIPYNLQFLADHNLYGMDFIDLQHITFRRPLPDTASFNTYNINTATEHHTHTNTQHTSINVSIDSNMSNGKIWTSTTTPVHMIASLTVKRHTYCELECDALAEHILNKSTVHTASLSQTDADAKLVQSLAQIWDMERSRRTRLRQMNNVENDRTSDELTVSGKKSPARQSRPLDTIEQNWWNAYKKLAAEDAALGIDNQHTNSEHDNSSQSHAPADSPISCTPSHVPLHMLMTPITPASHLTRRYSEVEADQLADVDINKLIESQTPQPVPTSKQLSQPHRSEIHQPQFDTDSDTDESSDELTPDERKQFDEKLQSMASQTQNSDGRHGDIEYEHSIDSSTSIIVHDTSCDSIPQLDGGADSSDDDNQSDIAQTQVINPIDQLVYGDTLPETQSTTPPPTPVYTTQSTQYTNGTQSTSYTHTSLSVQYDNESRPTLPHDSDTEMYSNPNHMPDDNSNYIIDHNTLHRTDVQHMLCYGYNINPPLIPDLQLQHLSTLHQKAYFSVPQHDEHYKTQGTTFASVTSNFYPMNIQPPPQLANSHPLYVSPFVGEFNSPQFFLNYSGSDIVDMSAEFSVIVSNDTFHHNHIHTVSEYCNAAFTYVLQPVEAPPHPQQIYIELKLTRNKRGMKRLGITDVHIDSGPVYESYGMQRRVADVATASQLFDHDEYSDQFSAYNTTQAPVITPAAMEQPPRIPSPKYDETFNMEVSYFLNDTTTSHNTSNKNTPPSSNNTQNDKRALNELHDINRRLTFESQSGSQDTMPAPVPKKPRHSLMNVSTDVIPDTTANNKQSDKPVQQQDADFNLHISDNQQQHLTIMTIEIHTCCRDKYLPDPLYDPVSAIIYHIKFLIHGAASKFNDITGILLLPEMPQHTDINSNIQLSQSSSYTGNSREIPPIGLPSHIRIDTYSSEHSMFHGFVRLVRQYDPDILCGYEIQKTSLGYMVERCAILKRNLCEELSRVIPVKSTKLRVRHDAAAIYAQTHSSGITIPGRIVLNLWRMFRDELKLGIYTYENVVLHVLNEHHYHVTPHILSQWFTSTIRAWQVAHQGSMPSVHDVLMPQSAHKSASHKSIPIEHTQPGGSGMYQCLMYHMQRAVTSYRLLDMLDVIGRTSELARVFGIKFFNVLDRGSQYRVESMVLRLSKPQSYLLCSLSPTQRASQPAMECLPLIMEPISRFYTDPVCVFDFQSLYPSMMIAYNMCYTTTLGKIPINNTLPATTQLDSQHVIHPIGGYHYVRQHGLLQSLSNDIWISPNGVVFLKPERRAGIVPRMLREILETRVMVKNTMKRAEVRHDPHLHRILNARQFGLKLIANVTYGYTAAGYSGRMPMAEFADAIVQTARHTLERAMYTVESHPTWNAKVLYGDTDSMFVMLPGRSKEQAFKIGTEITELITSQNPAPIKLQLEKIYLPCMLVSKKRYVGYKYEHAAQVQPILDAKGIELVRRDGCGALVTIMDKMIHILFSSRDMSLVRSYLERQWYNIYQHRINVQDFVFAKEVRLGTYKQLPLAALVATRAMQHDRRAEPVYAMRVPYVIVDGAPHDKLFDRVITPHQLLQNPSLYRLSPTYYCERVINPALSRLLDIAGVDIRVWYNAMPRPRKRQLISTAAHNTVVSTRQSAQGNTDDTIQWMNRFGRGTDGIASKLIDSFYSSNHCVTCDRMTDKRQLFCTTCLSTPSLLSYKLHTTYSKHQAEFNQLIDVCKRCMNNNPTINNTKQTKKQHAARNNRRRTSTRSGSTDIENLIQSTDINTGVRDVVCDALDCGYTYQRAELKQNVQLWNVYINQLDNYMLNIIP